MPIKFSSQVPPSGAIMQLGWRGGASMAKHSVRLTQYEAGNTQRYYICEHSIRFIFADRVTWFVAKQITVLIIDEQSFFLPSESMIWSLACFRN